MNQALYAHMNNKRKMKKKKKASDRRCHMDVPWKYCAEQKKPDT
jgi:hypothetical protein